MAHELAGKAVPKEMTIDIPGLLAAYYEFRPDPGVVSQRVAFGTSGHRGNALKRSFNQDHVMAITQAICEYRQQAGIDGPVYIGRDTHALSAPAQLTALRVFVGNGVAVRIAHDDGYVPTPVVSFTILRHNAKGGQKADGVVITPSHNPPLDGGFKYNPPNGGPADTDITSRIEARANEILADGLCDVRAVSVEKALKSDLVERYDFITPYVEALPQVIDMAAIARSKLRLAVDPMGGSALAVYEKINQIHGLEIEIVNREIDASFRFMRLDHDGRIRMDCSSPWAMGGLVALKERFDLAFGNDPDADRHGIVTKNGLMNPNHYLASAVSYLLKTRRRWPKEGLIGKTLVSSAMIDRAAREGGRDIYEVPVGFKWFVEGMVGGRLLFGGEESAGASFLRFDATAWSTDKDGLILNLLAAEMTAVTGESPDEHYRKLVERHGGFYYARVDAPATREQKEKLKALTPEEIKSDTLGGDPIEAIYTRAPGNGAPIGGLKIVTSGGWAAMRPSGTEEIYKIYAESFRSEEHLQRLLASAKAIVNEAVGS